MGAIDDLKLRKVNNQFILVPTGEASKRFSGEIKLNETAAFVWERLEKLSEEEIATELKHKYDISYEKALKDTGEIIKNFNEMGILRGVDEGVKTDTGVKIEDILDKDGVFISTTVGLSMYPLLKNRRDNVVIVKPKERLKRYDVALYRRDEKYILHRVIRVNENSYDICGDNCEYIEYGIPDGKIIGVAKEFYRKNKHVKEDDFFYMCYSKIWCFIFPVRMLYKKVRRFLGRVKGKMLRIIGKKEKNKI